ncbi:hypothetical protein ETAA1_19320 [Urbifossiella limnaea]|uniref:Uncharacterized protein n=2 Tax=Urbifossiella limnaea TaxID=2528023 RepID=A0A517XR69_9BACT|nr:hypothetical protein ETAA1_19320 [Urbifossiella limnaea]
MSNEHVVPKHFTVDHAVMVEQKERELEEQARRKGAYAEFLSRFHAMTAQSADTVRAARLYNLHFSAPPHDQWVAERADALLTAAEALADLWDHLGAYTDETAHINQPALYRLAQLLNFARRRDRDGVVKTLQTVLSREIAQTLLQGMNSRLNSLIDELPQVCLRRFRLQRRSLFPDYPTLFQFEFDADEQIDDQGNVIPKPKTVGEFLEYAERRVRRRASLLKLRDQHATDTATWNTIETQIEQEGTIYLGSFPGSRELFAEMERVHGPDTDILFLRTVVDKLSTGGENACDWPISRLIDVYKQIDDSAQPQRDSSGGSDHDDLCRGQSEEREGGKEASRVKGKFAIRFEADTVSITAFGLTRTRPLLGGYHDLAELLQQPNKSVSADDLHGKSRHRSGRQTSGRGGSTTRELANEAGLVERPPLPLEKSDSTATAQLLERKRVQTENRAKYLAEIADGGTEAELNDSRAALAKTTDELTQIDAYLRENTHGGEPKKVVKSRSAPTATLKRINTAREDLNKHGHPDLYDHLIRCIQPDGSGSGYVYRPTEDPCRNVAGWEVTHVTSDVTRT